jgi:hypothetical protein
VYSTLRSRDSLRATPRRALSARSEPGAEVMVVVGSSAGPP